MKNNPVQALMPNQPLWKKIQGSKPARIAQRQPVWKSVLAKANPVESLAKSPVGEYIGKNFQRNVLGRPLESDIQRAQRTGSQTQTLTREAAKPIAERNLIFEGGVIGAAGQAPKAITSATKNLLQQAKKYKTAEEFVNEKTITLYRAAPKFPKDNFPKNTFFSDNPNTARYYSESHYMGEPSDITVRKFTFPKSVIRKEGSARSFQLNESYPVSKNIKSQLKNIFNQAHKTKRPPKPKQIDAPTKEEMIDVIDYLRINKRIPDIEDTLERLIQKFNINPNLSSREIANKFEDLVEMTKTRY